MQLIDTVGHRENVGHGLISADDSKRLYARLHQQVAEASARQLSRERGLIQLFVRMTHDDEEEGPVTVNKLCADDAVLVQLLRSALGAYDADARSSERARRRWL